jgi:hypothetical protein
MFFFVSLLSKERKRNKSISKPCYKKVKIGTISQKTSDSTKKPTVKTREMLPLRMHSNFYDVRISKIDPAVTRAPPGIRACKIWAILWPKWAPSTRKQSPWWPQSLTSLAQRVTKALRLPSWSGRLFWGARQHRRCHRRRIWTSLFRLAYLRPFALGLPARCRLC